MYLRYSHCYCLSFMVALVFNSCSGSTENQLPQVENALTSDTSKQFFEDEILYKLDPDRISINASVRYRGFHRSQIKEITVQRIETLISKTEIKGTYEIEAPKETILSLKLTPSIFTSLFSGSKVTMTTIPSNLHPFEIQGLSIFEQKNPLDSALINTPSATIKAIGAKIVINDFNEEQPISKFSVIRGTVDISLANQNNKKCYRILPGHCLLLNNTIKSPTLEKCDSEEDASWSGGFFPLDPKLNKTNFYLLSNWFNVYFELDSTSAKKSLEGAIPLNSSLKSLLLILKENGYKSEVKGRTIIITSPNSEI